MNTNTLPNIKFVSSLDENINIIKNILSNDKTIVYNEMEAGKPVSTRCILIYLL